MVEAPGRRVAFIGIDVGTSACKTVLLSDSGRVIAVASRPYPTRRSIQGEATQNPRDWLRAVEETTRECASKAGELRIDGIAVTAPAHVGVLLDERGNQLARPLLAFDTRPAGIARALGNAYGKEFFDTTYVRLTSGWTFPQLIWLREQLGSVWSRIALVLTQKDFIRYAMTGSIAIDPSDAAGTAMVDQRTGTWSDHLCREAGLTIEQLPPIVGSTEIGGGLNQAWSRRLGIRAGTPVAVGATDTAAELLSVGAISEGASLVKIASTGTVVAVTSSPRPHPLLLTYPHAIGGSWYSLAATNSAATSFNWLNDLLACVDGNNANEDAILRSASKIPPGAEGVIFFPYLLGERTPHWDPHLRGAFLGLSAAHGKGHLVRAVFEGVAMSLRDCRDVMRQNGILIDEPQFTGGGCAIPLWRSILASVLGQIGHRIEPCGPAVGASVLAAAAVGHAVQPRQRWNAIKPNPRWVAAYQDLYHVYGDAARLLIDVSHRLADGNGSGQRPGS